MGLPIPRLCRPLQQGRCQRMGMSVGQTRARVSNKKINIPTIYSDIEELCKRKSNYDWFNGKNHLDMATHVY